MSIPEKFKPTIIDFVNDLSKTFPEYANLWEKWPNASDDEYQELFEYCTKIYPERFFDVLYQNVEIFLEDSETNTHFLPDVDFKLLFNCEGVSENTKKTIWKYIQLILFITVSSVKDKNSFGDTANLFEGIDENDLEQKLKDTMSDINGLFSNLGVDLDNMTENEEGEEDASGERQEFNFNPMEGMPDMAGLHEHLKGLFDGKIGQLAKELAEEISNDIPGLLGEEDGSKTTEDVLKNMMKNPKKMMGLIKTIGEKIKTKMDSGDISKDELMGEASELLSKMKEMGGGKQFNSILKKMAGGMGKNMRMDTGALTRMSKMESTRDRLLRKMEKNKNLKVQEGGGNMSFSIDNEEKQERSSIVPPKPQSDEELIAAFEEKDEEPKKAKKKKKKTKK
tara:strand:- start:18 stop:1199 length:1182 start_codon:yes stop_codon:yes gene_type:complete